MRILKIYIFRIIRIKVTLVWLGIFYESSSFKESCALSFTKKTLYSTLQNKIAATFVIHEKTYEDNIWYIWYICSVRGADLNYTKNAAV